MFVHQPKFGIRRSQRQKISPSPEPLFVNGVQSNSPNEQNSLRTTSTIPSSNEMKIICSPSEPFQPAPTENIVTTTNNFVDQDLQLSQSFSSSSLLNGKKNFSTSDLDPIERKKQTAINKVQAKLDKAQRLYQAAQLSVEQNISEFLRVTTLPGLLNDSNSSKTTNAAFDKRIRTLQETKKELERKINNYQTDLARIHDGDIPNQYSSSKDILNNIKSKVSNSNNKNRSSNDISGSSIQETTITTTNLQENDQNLSSSTGITRSSINQQNFPSQTSSNHNIEPVRYSPSNSITNEIGNSQLNINSKHDHIYDNDKTTRKYENHGVNEEFSANFHENEKSPQTKRRLTEDSTIDINDHVSDHSSDERYASFNASKRNTMTIQDYHQLTGKIESMQKLIDRYETKIVDLQKSIDLSNSNDEAQRAQIERLNIEITDLTDLHQAEMLTMKTDLKKLEDKLIYNIQEYWNEMVEKLDKLDTRTTKVEQTQTHSFENEENTHRVITKLVNILLTFFAIILLLLSTIKNLVQSRLHAFIILMLIFLWVAANYFPDNPVTGFVLTNLENRFKYKADPSD